MNHSQPHFSPIGQSLIDRSFKHAEGVYETIRVHHGKPLHLDLHLDRLEVSARSLAIQIPISPEALAVQVIRTIEASSFPEAVIYIQVTLSVDGLALREKNGNVVPLVTITCDIFLPKPSTWYTHGIRITIKPFDRIHPDAKNFTQYAAKKQLRLTSGFDEVLMQNHEGHITEGTQTNIFIVKDNSLITPDSEMLPGVTRHVVSGLTKILLPTFERPLTREDIRTADECFVTGTLCGIAPVTSIDDQPIGNGTVGPWTKKIMELYEQEVS